MKIEQGAHTSHLTDTRLQDEFKRLHSHLSVYGDTDLIALELAGQELERRGFVVLPSVDFVRAEACT